jgi:hypothetical protein
MLKPDSIYTVFTQAKIKDCSFTGIEPGLRVTTEGGTGFADVSGLMFGRI